MKDGSNTKQNNTQITHAAFQRWVHSLSAEELLIAMQVSFVLEGGKYTTSTATASTLFRDWRQQQTATTTTTTTTTGNTELDLLHEMIHSQVPLPTPIHGRAIPYMTASSNKCRDGRNERERIQRDRMVRPRLFRWREQRHTTTSTTAALMDMLPRSKRSRFLAASSSSQSTTATTAATTTTRHQQQQQYNVQARKFIQPAGERLSLGCTWEQQQADAFVWQNAVFRQVASDTTRLELVLPLDFALASSNNSKGDQLLLLSSSSSSKKKKQTLLRLLKIASRGRFLSCEYAASCRQTSSSSSSSLPLSPRAPWLNPVEEWFSLSLYLVSLFEGALWDSFLQSKKSPTKLQTQQQQQHKEEALSRLWPGLDALVTPSEIQMAVSNCLVQTLKQDMQALDVAVLMDSLLWDVLIEGNRPVGGGGGGHRTITEMLQTDDSTPSQLLESIVVCPITQLNTSVDYFKQVAQYAVQEAFVKATESKLLQEEEVEQQQQQQKAQKQRGGKKKKKKSSHGKNNRPLVRPSTNAAAAHPVTFSDPPAIIVEPISSSDEAATEEEEDDDDGNKKKQQHRIEFPENRTSVRERNRNIVIAMSILEDVLDGIAEEQQPQEHVYDTLEDKNSEDCQKDCTTKQVDSQEDCTLEQTEDDKDQSSLEVSLHGIRDESPERSFKKQGSSVAASSQSTASPTLSPIMMSLSDLCDARRDPNRGGGLNREQSDSLKVASVRSISSVSALSLPGTTESRTQPPQLLPSKSHDSVMSPNRGGEEPKERSTDKLSPLSNRESDELSNIKEERDMYRDMCLTLGAEVAKLKNMFAAQRSATQDPSLDFSPARTYVYSTMGFDPESMPPPFDIAPCAQTMAAMSDTGFRGEHESQASEDDNGRMLMNESSRQISSGTTVGGSDVSVDHNSSHQRLSYNAVGVSLARDAYDPVALHGMQSRLTRDIQRFLESNNQQLRKQESRRQTAIVRITKLVNTMWPRAQVKLYGSFVTGLCLPSSDLDFVICLPAVHKKAIAVAPGVLEGRNAINETSQKLLARTLSAEAWVDTRSMKLIERTAVPVIKVLTKDNRAKALQLDITFDSSGHHGLDGVILMSQIMDELPMLRPLVVVLKQFLSHRGLLTSYTGGLSSYALFLMVARYLQEQPSSWGDCGSLLMGFLDFYGNNVSLSCVHSKEKWIRFLTILFS